MATEITATTTEIERCALMMLKTTRSYHPTLSAWVAQVIADPSYDEYLSDGNLVDRILAHDPETITNGMDERYQRQARYQHEGTYRLATAIVMYRRAGRQDGDRTISIMGLGGPIATLTTSLAAAIVEYHEYIVNSYCIELEEVDA